MYSKIARSACRRVYCGCRQISSALLDLKNVSTAALKLLYSSSGDLSYFRDAKLAVDFANDVAFQATNDFAFALSVFCTFLNISQSCFVASDPDNDQAIKGGVGLWISALVQSEAVCFAAECRGWATPQSFANAACQRMRIGSSPTSINISATVSVAMPRDAK